MATPNREKIRKTTQSKILITVKHPLTIFDHNKPSRTQFTRIAQTLISANWFSSTTQPHKRYLVSAHIRK